MITVQREVQGDHHRGPDELELLKLKINDQQYLYDAINCLAMILSNEILNIRQGGIDHEWERRIPAQRVSPPGAD
jgi:hypothetical protein